MANGTIYLLNKGKSQSQFIPSALVVALLTIVPSLLLGLGNHIQSILTVR